MVDRKPNLPVIKKGKSRAIKARREKAGWELRVREAAWGCSELAPVPHAGLRDKAAVSGLQELSFL